MRWILCIIMAVFVLSISAVTIGHACDAKPVKPADPVTLPAVDPQQLDTAMKSLAAALATNNYDAIGNSLGAAEEQLAAVVGAGSDVKAKVKVDAEHQKAAATLKITAQGKASSCHAKNVLTVKAKAKHTDDGTWNVVLKVNGHFTEQQKAYIQGLFQKYQGQLPGVNVTLKIC